MATYAAVDFALAQQKIAAGTDLSAYPAGTLRYLARRGVVASQTTFKAARAFSYAGTSYAVDATVAGLPTGTLIQLLRSGHVVGGAPAGYAASVLADTPLRFWKLDDLASPGTAADSSGNGQTLGAGPLLGQASTPIVGKTTAAFSNFSFFDGGNVLSQAGSPISVEAFFRLNGGWPGGTNGQFAPLVTKDGSWRLSRNSGNDELGFFIGNTSAQVISTNGGAGWQSGAWFHVVGTYDGANLNLYSNGLLVTGPVAYAGGIPAGDAGTFRIGHWASDTLKNFGTGFLSHVAIYGTALSAARVAAHYAALANGA